MKSLSILIAILFYAHFLDAKPTEMEILTTHLQNHPELFEKINITDSSRPTNFHIELGKSTLTLPNKNSLDGFRFTAPKGAKKKDFLWYFNAPTEWGNWYISPVTEEPKPAFKDWLDADKIYQHFDSANQNNRTRVLQTLKAGYFTEGEEYIIWFRHVKKGGDQSLKGRFLFCSLEKNNDYEELEKNLELIPQTNEKQIKALNSRGGKILLDDNFFASDYATNRINSVFFSIRQTKRMKNGFFITMEIAVPPCETTPSYSLIREKYGAPDFIQTSDEANQVRKHAGGDTDEDADPPTIVYYYDYFGYEVASDDKEKKVLRVITHANDFSKLHSQSKGATYGQIPMKNLTVLHRNGTEVGRLYYFMEGKKKPLCVKEPPSGKYWQDRMALEYLGNEKWMLTTIDENETVVRKVPYAKHLMNGKAEGFYPSGKPRFIAHYLDGQLNGSVIQYAETGEVTAEYTFKKGQQVTTK